jgi:hypothetical protein
VRVVWDRVSNGRYVGRAIGSTDTFDIIDGELDFSWTADMKPHTTGYSMSALMVAERTTGQQ